MYKRQILRIPAALVTVVDDEQPLSVLTPLPLRAGSGPAPAPAVAAVPPMRGADEQDGPWLADRHHQPGPHPAPAIHVVPAPGTDGSAGDPSPARCSDSPGSPGSPDAPDAPDSPADDGTGLPTRRRRRPLAAGEADTPATAAGRTPERAAAHWQALQQGTDSGRAAVARAVREDAMRQNSDSPTDPTPGDTSAGRPTGDTTTGPTTLEGAEK